MARAAEFKASRKSTGFTLIELSIVLVIIGLIVGGVLAGQDLIRAAGERAQIAQIEKYNTAVNTFYGKYGALPGDLNAQVATLFGFTPRGQYAGEGDGNGLIEGVSFNIAGDNFGNCEQTGETAMFWVDLSLANGLNVNLIDGSFNAASPNTAPTTLTPSLYYPAAKIGGGNFIYVWSGSFSATGPASGQNWFGLSAITSMDSGGCHLNSNLGLTVKQAYDIDKKIDDGYPQTGNVRAEYLTGVTWPNWANNDNNNGVPYQTATTGSSTTCYDNGGGSGPQQYSLEISNGNNVNCALSFKMQGGD
jgi:prepilin-type N-terminal cleavage/methylation domain-containing protein